MGFNRAAGPNRLNDLGDNTVNVIKVDGNNGVDYAQSQLIGLLDMNPGYSEMSIPGIVSYADLKIRVNSINTAVTPGVARLTIGFDQCADNAACAANAGGCFTSTCDGQGMPGANLLGCVNTPIPNCCGNGMCEQGENAASCAVDCLAGGTVWPDDCPSCWVSSDG